MNPTINIEDVNQIVGNLVLQSHLQLLTLTRANQEANRKNVELLGQLAELRAKAAQLEARPSKGTKGGK